MKSFSLSTLLLVVLIVALSVSLFIMMRQLSEARVEVSEARVEVENIRRKFGHIRIDNANMTYVALIPEVEGNSIAYRIIVPAGSRYLLHLTDTIIEQEGLTDPIPTKTISLNTWQDGADVVLSYTIYMENNVPRIVVHTNSEELFNYIPPAWVPSAGPTESSQLQADPQRAYTTEQSIQFMSWKDPTTKRGIMLWLEPHSEWQARRNAKAAATKSDAP